MCVFTCDACSMEPSLDPDRDGPPDPTPAFAPAPKPGPDPDSDPDSARDPEGAPGLCSRLIAACSRTCMYGGRNKKMVKCFTLDPLKAWLALTADMWIRAVGRALRLSFNSTSGRRGASCSRCPAAGRCTMASGCSQCATSPWEAAMYTRSATYQGD